MSEEIRATLREFVTAMTKGDVEKAAALCTEDVVWETPEGRFEGIDELKRYVAWTTQTVVSPNRKYCRNRAERSKHDEQ